MEKSSLLDWSNSFIHSELVRLKEEEGERGTNDLRVDRSFTSFRIRR